LSPEYSTAYDTRAEVYSILGEYDKALQDYSSMIEQFTYGPGISYIKRGNVYIAMKQYDKAIQDYSKAIERDPKDPRAYNSLGRAYFIMKQYDNAIYNYFKALELALCQAEPYPGLLYVSLETASPEQFCRWFKLFEPTIPDEKLTKESLILKLYLTCINKFILNEPCANIENRLNAMLKDVVELYWSTELLNEWFSSPLNGLNSAKAGISRLSNNIYFIKNDSYTINRNPDDAGTYLDVMRMNLVCARMDQFNKWLKQFETKFPENKLSKENLIIKLYLICVMKCIQNEPRTEIEKQLEALLKDKFESNRDIEVWTRNGLQTIVTQEQLKYIRELTDKGKASQKNLH